MTLRPVASLSLALALAAGAIPAGSARAQIKAFPQAEGFGATALGGRGGDVYHVTNLTDAGVGSLRFGLENAPASGRTIVFDVGGWITLTSKLGLTKNRVTIAGQTAPGGIGLRNGQFSVGADDVVVRHMRFRPGKITNTDHDSVNTNENAQRVIYDHISAEFSTDGGFDLQADDVTLQYSSVSFGLLTHSTGGLIQSPTGGAAGKLSFHHNMFAHNETRNPKARAELIDWRDNVVFNYHNGFLAGESETNVEPNWRANFDGNTYISNIGGNAGSGGRPMMTGGRTQNYDLWFGVNALDRDADSAADPIEYTKAQAQSSQQIVSSQYNWSDAPFPAAEVWQSGSPAAAYTRVLQEFGATPWARDAVNQLIYNQVLARTGQRISNENQLGIANAGYPNLNPNNLTAPLDTDGDGMPDAWEIKHGLSPKTASNNADFDGDGSTNLEEYLNDLAAFKAVGPLEFDGAGRYADWANWSRQWEPSRVDDVFIPTGTATVDAVGQKAGLLRVGSLAGNTGELAVTDGWIEVTSNLQVGVGGSGVVNQSGGTVALLSGSISLTDGNYNLSGGTLVAPQVTQSATGSLNLTGGRLSVGAITGDVASNGAAIAPGIGPGASPGVTHIEGDLTLNSGVLEIEIGGKQFGEFDRVEVDGVAHLGGTLRVTLVDIGPGGGGGAFVPQLGDSFAFLSSAGTSGAFAAFDLPALAPGLAWAILPGDVATFLGVVQQPLSNPADFNRDGHVDAQDLAAWSAGYGMTSQSNNSAGDANADGAVDGADFLLWQQQLNPAGFASTPASAPEPESLALAALALCIARRQHPSRA
jgi:pectate lyase